VFAPTLTYPHGVAAVVGCQVPGLPSRNTRSNFHPKSPVKRLGRGDVVREQVVPDEFAASCVPVGSEPVTVHAAPLSQNE
jgi:hypothetical protein